MSNKYNDCVECSVFPESNRMVYDIIFNELITKLPPELCYKIIELSVDYNYCSFCEIKLCDYHSIYAKYYLKYYDHGYICNKCCQKL